MVLQCADRSGLVAVISGFFADAQISIARFEQYTDAGNFFARVEWSTLEGWRTEAEFEKDFNTLASSLDAAFSAHFFDAIQRLGLFV